MPKPKISIICALSENRAIGKNGRLLWHIPEDLERFRKLTLGHPVIMGRKTFESIGKPLPDRLNIIITQKSDFTHPGCVICHSLTEAIEAAAKKEKEEIFIIGGGQIYTQAIGLADKLYLTLVEGNFEADTFFPDYSAFKKVVFEKKGEAQGLKYQFIELER